MTMLRKVEKVERELFKAGHFTFKNTVLTGKKGKDNIKLDSVYNRTYPSQKYSNQQELTATTISTSEFLVFGYNNFESKLNEEIYISHPNLTDIRNFCQQILAMVMSKDVFNNNNTVNMNYQDYSIASQPFAGGKTLVAIPASLQRDQNLIKGIYLFFNSEDKYIEMDVKGVFTLNEMIKCMDSANLMLFSNTTLMLGMMGNMGSIQPEEEVYAPVPKSPLPPRGNFFGNKGGPRFQTRSEGQPKAPTAPVTETNDPFNNANNNDDDVPFTGPTPTPTAPKFKRPGTTTGLPPRSSNVAPTQEASGGDVMNFDSIMQDANNIQFDNSGDEDIEF